MSYTHLIKEEILTKALINKIEIDFELYAILKAKNAIYADRIDFRNENIAIAKRVYSGLKELAKVRIEIKYIMSKHFGMHKEYVVLIRYQQNFKKIIKHFDKIRVKDIQKSESKIKGYIRGMFLATGYIKQPEKEYALDFFISDREDALKLYEVFSRLDKKVFFTEKRNKYLVYLRNSEDIMDILVMLGATKAFFEYEEVTLVKEIRNKTIRSINWEVANETKAMSLGQRQIRMIEHLDKKIGLETLSFVLQEVAEVRLKNSESSLREIAEIIGITKSGVRGRFKRLNDLYEELGEG